MPISELKIENFRAFKNTGIIKFDKTSVIVGKNDVGKSGILHALKVFFEPPKKGIEKHECHAGNFSEFSIIEVAFDPKLLKTQDIKIDAKNSMNIVDDMLVGKDGLLRLRIKLSISKVEAFEILINDVQTDSPIPLGFMDHDELITALKKYHLKASKAGIETNQEKRNALRAYFKKIGRGDTESWCSVLEHEKPIREILPVFVLYSDDANFDPNETSVQNQFKHIVSKSLESNEAANNLSGKVKETIQFEFNKISERLFRLTDTIKSVKANASVNWKKAVEGIGLEWGDDSGMFLPFQYRGAGIRRLFMVAYFQYTAATTLHDPDSPKFIFAIEEPEVHLHPGAQSLLKDAFSEISDLGHRVVFTTHSPVFTANALINSIILVKRGLEKNSICEQAPSLNIIKVAEELGVEPSHRLIGRNCVILVEGVDDVFIYEQFLLKLYESGKTRLKPESVLFLQCGGIDNIAFTANLNSITTAGLKWAIITDSDRQTRCGDIRKGKMREIISNKPPTCLFIHALDKTSIENYLDEKIANRIAGFEFKIPEFGKITDVNGTIIPSQQSGVFKARNKQIASEMSSEDIIKSSIRPNGESEFVWIFDELQKAFSLTEKNI